jgi:sirohydrochlorin ferrochelatase
MTMPNPESRGSRAETSGQQSLPREERGGGGSAREQIRQVKDQVVDQAKTTFQQARERAGSSLGESKGQFAEQFGTIAEALRRTTEHLRSEDQQRIAGLTETVARQVDQVANYLRSKDARAMRLDLENLARRQPALVLGGALVLGLLGARFLKSSERNRGGRRLGDGRGYDRDQGYGYTGYNQPFSGETERHLAAGARSGGGYAGS